MSWIPLYPVVLAAATVAAVAAGTGLLGDRQWGRILLLTGAVQIVGYAIVSRALFLTDQLLPQQFLFAVVAIGLTTKIVVFAPALLARVAVPGLVPTFERRHLVVGLAGGWLIQATLALLYLFPADPLGNLLFWLHPASPVTAYLPLLLVGVLVAQVVIAGRIHAATDIQPKPLETSVGAPAGAAPGDGETSVQAVADGGCDD